MTDLKRIMVKAVVVGDEAAKKSDLIRPSVVSTFDESYIRTLGMVVRAKDVTLRSPDGTQQTVTMRIHDIVGKLGSLASFNQAYFYGAKAVLAVCDAALPATVRHLKDWIEGVYAVTGRVPTYILARADRPDPDAARQVEELSMAYGAPFAWVRNPGENVEAAFEWLAVHIATQSPRMESSLNPGVIGLPDHELAGDASRPP